jgi:hypothetical protein
MRCVRVRVLPEPAPAKNEQRAVAVCYGLALRLVQPANKIHVHMCFRVGFQVEYSKTLNLEPGIMTCYSGWGWAILR